MAGASCLCVPLLGGAVAQLRRGQDSKSFSGIVPDRSTVRIALFF